MVDRRVPGTLQRSSRSWPLDRHHHRHEAQGERGAEPVCSFAAVPHARRLVEESSQPRGAAPAHLSDYMLEVLCAEVLV
jgi:hypothetical protein